MVFAVLDWATITGALALLDIGLVVVMIAWVLTIKREPTSALAWCLLVVFVPLVGSLLFLLLGYQSIHAPLRRKRRRSADFHTPPLMPGRPEAPGGYEGLAGLACRLGAAPLAHGNAVDLYHAGEPAYEAMLAAI